MRDPNLRQTITDKLREHAIHLLRATQSQARDRAHDEVAEAFEAVALDLRKARRPLPKAAAEPRPNVHGNTGRGISSGGYPTRYQHAAALVRSGMDHLRVAKEMGTTPNLANAHIAQARRRGLLPPV